MKYHPYDLEERLIDFAVMIVQNVETLPKNMAGKHLGDQLLRSGTAPALLYGEAQGAESRKDFIHKMKIALKELRETSINLKILAKINILSNPKLLDECSQLIAIFTKSIETAAQSD